MKKIGVFIGRMQPLHNGHLQIIKSILAECDGIVIGIGSSNKARSTKNPFLYEERKRIIRHALMVDSGMDIGKQLAHTRIVGLPDFTYNDDMWFEVAASTIEPAAKNLAGDGEECEIVLYGFRKADTFYLDHFPQWGKCMLKRRKFDFSATDVRAELFKPEVKMDDPLWVDKVPEGAREWITTFFESEEGKPIHEQLIDEKTRVEAIVAAKQPNEYDPHPRIDHTVDSVVICNSHILMVTRGAVPGIGQLALPGGYLNYSETVPNGIVRELCEETQIDKLNDWVSKKLLKAMLVNGNKIERYDDPERSTRGRIITECGLIRLNSKDLPEVRGDDDAAHAQWVPLYKLDELATNIFEDHYCIIRKMLGYC